MKAPELKAPELKALEFDRAFDAGEDVSGHVDWPQARRVNLEARRVNVDFPAWVVDALDREARLRGVPRQSLIKLWIAERLEETSYARRPRSRRPAGTATPAR